MNPVSFLVARLAADQNTPLFKDPTGNALESVYLKRYSQRFRQEVESPSNFAPLGSLDRESAGAKEQAAPSAEAA